jgi:hypothetical protein
LPQASILANKRLQHKLGLFGYIDHVNTPGLWHHESQPILFTLNVNDFRMKYTDKKDYDHLIASIKAMYKLIEDWTGSLYCGMISLIWDYVHWTVDISKPGYVKKEIARVQSHYFKANPNVSALTISKAIWVGGARATFRR